jgi:DNA-binding winged helix-turn-helix (wHTH) protein/pimeloyl-ACP methyl ester carboxylesterase
LLYTFEDCLLHPERRELRRGGMVVPVEPLVFDLLEYLIRNRARVVSKDELITSVWRGRIVSESTLTSRMNAARHAIGDSGDQQRLIKTFSRKGFRFVGETLAREEATDCSSVGTSSAVGRQANAASALDAPTVSFCKANDGVSLAVSASGKGAVLLRTTSWINHLEHEWQNPLTAPLLHRLSSRFKLVRYDGRGAGLSDREISDMSFERYRDDLDAIVDWLKVQKFAVFGWSGGAALAIHYAAHNRERVSRLVLLGGYALGRNKRRSPQTAEEAKAFITMMRNRWGDDESPFWRAFSSFFIPNATPEQRAWWFALQRAAFTTDSAILARQAVDDIDVLECCRLVKAPTIVFHSRRDNLVPFDQGRLIAASIPGAQLVPLDSENHILLPHEPAWAKLVGDIEAFLVDEN